MLGLGALLALEITTSTPDALCPPLEEARAAVRARVGEVRGAYQAEFALVRGDDGRPSLELVVREADEVRLRRSLPLEGVRCADAAQAIALVLERYFDTVDKPAPASEAEPQPVLPVSLEPAASSPASPGRAPAPTAASRSDAPSARAVEASPPAAAQRLRLRAGAVYDVEHELGASLGVSYFPAVGRAVGRLRVGFSLDGTGFLSRARESIRGQEVSATTWQAALSVPLSFEAAPVRLGVGPWAQLRYQRAEAPTLRDGGAASRPLFGIGGAALAGWSFHRDWALGASFAFGAQLSEVAPRFVLRQEGGGREPVLVPHAWFGQAQLAIELSL